jgi:DNA-binding GntR family transcriptional regulator
MTLDPLAETANIQQPSLGDRAYERIKALIQAGEIRAGERLRYKDMVELLGVSQTPVKEAFTKLEIEGYVVTIKRKGTFVREFSTREIREIFQIREMLEALAVRLVCEHHSKLDFGKLSEINQRFLRAAQDRDLDACTEEDYNFHEMLIRMSGNAKLLEIMSKTNLHLLSIAQSSPNFLEIANAYYKKHTEIVGALETGDAAAAERLMREHITYGQTQVLAAMKVAQLQPRESD